VNRIIKEFINKKMYFKFYEQFNQKILKPYAYEGKHMVEYKTEQNKRVFIHYIQEDLVGIGEYKTEEMEQTYPGIYNKMFTIFFGEKIQYYIIEDNNVDNIVTNNIIVKNEMDLYSTQSRYNLLNDMSVAYAMHDNETLLILMKRYAVYCQAAETLFKSI
jgi:hypothetical protein